jgi:hypothetical protein
VFENWNRGELDSFLIEITKDILKFKDSDGEFEMFRNASKNVAVSLQAACVSFLKGMEPGVLQFLEVL